MTEIPGFTTVDSPLIAELSVRKLALGKNVHATVLLVLSCVAARSEVAANAGRADLGLQLYGHRLEPGEQVVWFPAVDDDGADHFRDDRAESVAAADNDDSSCADSADSARTWIDRVWRLDRGADSVVGSADGDLPWRRGRLWV